MEYRYEVKSVEGFVQLVASNYLPHGYWFYVTGSVPSGKSAQYVDEKILSKYQIRMSRQQRARRKLQGFANLHYVRFENFFLILSTHGKHLFFEHEANNYRDIRRVPLQFHGYSLTVRQGGRLRKIHSSQPALPDSRFRVRVMISKAAWSEHRAYLLDMATHRDAETLRWAFWNLPFEPYAPIRRQLLMLLRAVNSKRAAKGYEKLPYDVIRYRRNIVKPFGDEEVSTSQAA